MIAVVRGRAKDEKKLLHSRQIGVIRPLRGGCVSFDSFPAINSTNSGIVYASYYKRHETESHDECIYRRSFGWNHNHLYRSSMGIVCREWRGGEISKPCSTVNPQFHQSIQLVRFCLWPQRSPVSSRIVLGTVISRSKRSNVYDTRCYFNVRSKADMSQLNLPHGTDN